MVGHGDRERVFLRECFGLADDRRRGYLDLNDLKCGVAAALGIRASKLMLAQMFQSVFQEHEAQPMEARVQINQHDFVAVLLPRVQRTDVLELVRRDFKAFDLRAQGFISFASFQAACASVMPHMSQKTMFEIFREADRDGDGRVTYNDFETIYLLAEQGSHQRSNTLSQRPPQRHTYRR